MTACQEKVSTSDYFLSTINDLLSMKFLACEKWKPAEVDRKRLYISCMDRIIALTIGGMDVL